MKQKWALRCPVGTLTKERHCFIQILVAILADHAATIIVFVFELIIFLMFLYSYIGIIFWYLL